jgi:hypothetical protein
MFDSDQRPWRRVNVMLAPDVFANYREAVHGAFVLIEGVVRQDYGAINVLAQVISGV